MDLPKRGIARGRNMMHSLVSDKILDIDLNIDPTKSWINSLFDDIGYKSEEQKVLRDYVFKIIQIACENNIGIHSMTRTKVIGTSYIVLKRCNDKKLNPNPPASIKTFCVDLIKKNTIDRFLKDLNAYHSYFKDYYESVGLYSEPF
jgi:hypothetical protein